MHRNRYAVRKDRFCKQHSPHPLNEGMDGAIMCLRQREGTKGLFILHLQSRSDVHSLRSHCTCVGVKPDWIRIHLNLLQEVVSIRMEVNPV